ncbi:hypothetical protein DFH09DRAFT_1154478 [Mycena vulgaris]|nr:hypothetical protein DFH09DRAFT_1154478 [Mycena vulgaris]
MVEKAEEPSLNLKDLEHLSVKNALVISFKDHIPEVVKWATSKKRVSSRIISLESSLVVLRVIPGPIYEAATATFSAQLNFSGQTRFGQFWMENIVPKGARTVQLGHAEKNDKQPDASWGPQGGKPTVVLEVGASETISQLRDDMARWFTAGSSTKLVILIDIAKRPGQAPRCLVEFYENILDPTGRRRTSTLTRIYSSQWDNLTAETPPLSIPLHYFLSNDAPQPIALNPEIVISQAAMAHIYESIRVAAEEEEV